MLSLQESAPRDPKIGRFFAFCAKALPYLLLLGATLICFTVYFQTGDRIPTGDDARWHLLWVYDLSEGWANGSFLTTPSHTLMGNLGYGLYLFYGPLSHYLVALIHLTGISIVWSWKILLIGSSYLMGIWAYHLGRVLLKNDLSGLMIGLICLFLPYRLNNIFYRAAWPEAFALSFLPLLFLGVHQIGHGDFRPICFLRCVLGVAAMVLSHPFTALFSVGAAFLYLCFSYKVFVKIWKDKRALILTLCSVALILCLVLWYAVPMYQNLRSGLYCVSDAEAMWTNAAHCAESTVDSTLCGGFLRYDWIGKYADIKNLHNESWTSWMCDYAIFFTLSSVGVILMTLGKKKGYTVAGTLTGSFVALLAMGFTSRIEMYLVVPIFCLGLLLIGFSDSSRRETKEISHLAAEQAKSPETYLVILLFAACLVLCYAPKVWEYMPQAVLDAQFAWRFWGLGMFLLLLLIVFIVRPYAHAPQAQGALLVVAGICFLSCMSIIDKRFCLDSGRLGDAEPTATSVYSYKGMGCQNEYAPMVFKESGYVSEYPNSLYSEIRNEIYGKGSYQWGAEDYLDPAFLEGSGEMKIVSLSSPNAEFTLRVDTEKALIQLPQFYYEGYELSLRGASSYKVSGQNVDGLVSFAVTQGEYEASLQWVGPLAYRIGVPLFFAGLAGCVALVTVPWAIDKAKAKKAQEAPKA